MSADITLTPAAWDGFFNHPKTEFLTRIRADLRQVLEDNLDPERNWQMDDWKKAISALPPADKAASPQVSRQGVVEVGPAGDSDVVRDALGVRDALRGLMPWRKGPWNIAGIDIDTEWRSDWKWDRVLPHLSDLTGRRVLDIGCGNGYHLWRMAQAGADAVVGLEPHLLNVAQYACVQRYTSDLPVTVLPMPLEEYPVNSRIYDTAFSMGVLYHRKSPVDHLLHAKSCLREGGEFVLETLIVPGDDLTVLVPQDRYAKMRNVWYLGSVGHITRLLERTGFIDIRLVNENITSTDEQRATEWMEFESLPDFLDPEDASKTVEGYPAPRRAVFICTAP